jgi:hypothetical protein
LGLPAVRAFHLLDYLRRPLFARIAAPALVLGLALAWAAPARAARAWATERSRVTELLTADDAARVDAALEAASRRTSSPEAFAAEVVRALAGGPAAGDVSPAADALLRALFGRMIQAMTLGGGSPVFLVPATADGPAPAPAECAAATGSGTGAPTRAQAPAPLDPPSLRVPREARPQVQTLGP